MDAVLISVPDAPCMPHVNWPGIYVYRCAWALRR